MRPLGSADSPNYKTGRTAASPSRTRTSTSTYVSSLSNALNIPTSRSTREVTTPGTLYPETPFSTPSNPARSPFEPHTSSTQCGDALHTPTRNAAAPRVLSLTDQNAFQSLTSPLAPWSPPSVSPAHAETSEGRSSVDWDQDHQWWVSGPSSRRCDDVLLSNTGSPLLSLSSSFVPSEAIQQTNAEQASFTERERQSHRLQHAIGYTPFTLQMPPAPIVPDSSSIPSMSRAPFALSLPSTSMDDTSDASDARRLEHETPSLSTHMLPSNDLTEYLQIGNRIREAGTLHASTSNMFSQDACTGKERPFAEIEDAPALSQFTNSAASDAKEACVKWPSAHIDRVNDLRLFELERFAQHSSVSHNELHTDHRMPFGLGLNLNAGTISEQVEMLTSPAPDASRTPVLTDAGSEWRRKWKEQSLDLFDDSRVAEGEGRSIHEASMSTLSTTTESSFASHSNTSTWDSSFGQAPSSCGGDDSAVAGHFVDTSASSIGHNRSRNARAERPSVERPSSSGTTALTSTPEVFMQDLSEFGQSIPIQDMAEERWRTWPRHRDGRSVVSPINKAQADLASVKSTTGETRSSLDVLSASVSSTRSRLMAEPYNKNLRSGRPSSSASTSTRSSISGSIILEDEPSNLVTGPIRPRSFVGAGPLRMSSATRTNTGVGSDKLSSPKERVSGTAMALRHVRRLSHGSPASSAAASSSAMRLTRSIDSVGAADSRARYSIAVPSVLGSSDGSLTTSQRPQSMVDFTSSYRDLPLKPGAGNGSKSSSKVGFSEVSEALDTLRLFLKQRKPGNSDDASDQIRDQPLSPNEGSRQPSSPEKQGRTLRRSKRLLPPRGETSSVDEFGTLQLTASSKVRQGASSHQINEEEASQPTHAKPSSLPTQSKKDDRLAVLEDLSERVMRLKAESELENERRAAASMPPPGVRPASKGHQHIPPNPSRTRREMHDEYLQKRTSRS